MRVRLRVRLAALFLLVIPGLLAVALAGCATAPARPLRAGEPAPLIPLRHFFVNPEWSSLYKLSPDGTRVAWLESFRRRLTVWARTLATGELRVIDTHSPRSIHWFAWARDSRRILFGQDREGDENFHVYVADVEHPDAPPRDLTPFPGVSAKIVRFIRSDPRPVLIAHNRRDRAAFDLYRVDLTTAAETLVARNPGDVLTWIADHEGRLRGAVRRLPTNEWRLDLRDAASDRWTPVRSWDLDETVTFAGFTPDDEGIWVLSNAGRDRVALVRLDLASGKETAVYEHPRVDVEAVLGSSLTRLPLLAMTHPDFPEVHFFDQALAADLHHLAARQPAGIRLLSFDDEERVLTAEVVTEAGSEFYLVDRLTGERTLLARSPLTRYAEWLAPMRPVAFTSRDGLRLHGYLTLPRGVEPRGLPMVLFVHGGPWERDFWGHNPVVQFLANRGYAVLQVNFRGSTGYGRGFQQAAIGEFAGKMRDDLIDGVRWAVEQGVANPRRVGIFGWSYGGYATLVGLTFTPEVFACGVAVAAPSNLVTFLESTPLSRKLAFPRWHRYVGNPSHPEDRRRMEAKSPLFRAQAARSPVLIIHGANDARVPQRESDQMVAALRAGGKPVEYVVFREGHLGFKDWRNRLKLYRRVEDFLARHLGGRTAGFDLYQLGALGR